MNLSSGFTDILVHIYSVFLQLLSIVDNHNHISFVCERNGLSEVLFYKLVRISFTWNLCWKCPI